MDDAQTRELAEAGDRAMDEDDAGTLEDAAEVLQRRFGKLTAGDLITGLTGAAASIRAKGGIIKPVEPPEVTEAADSQDDDQYDPEHPHGYWEKGDY